MGISNCMKSNDESNQISAQMNGTQIYHERQVREMCALHALNNLFQNESAFSKAELDSLCYKLSPDAYFNPHKSIFGMGNYDVNVVIAALQTKGYETLWFDKRKDIKTVVLDSIIGFILNVPTDYKWGIIHLPVHRKHWITVRKIGSLYYNLDSKLDAPELIGKKEDIHNFLMDQIKCPDKELLVIVSHDVAQNGTWIESKEHSHESDTPET